MAKSYLITSGKGGTGKTTTAVNLGAAFNKLKEDVVIVDGNISTPNIGLYFGAPIVPVSLNHVLKGEAGIGEAVYEHESGTKIVPCSLSLKDMKRLKPKSMKKVTTNLKKISDHVIIDSAAGLDNETQSAMSAVDEVIIVTNPNILSVTDSLKTIKLAEEMGKPVRGVIITRVRGKRTEMPLRNIKEMLEVPILGIVPEDEHVERALIRKDAVIHTKPRSKAARSYHRIAAKILGKKRISDSFYRKIMNIFR